MGGCPRPPRRPAPTRRAFFVWSRSATTPGAILRPALSKGEGALAMAPPSIEEYEKLFAADPGSEVSVDLAAALVQQGRYDNAIEVCSRALEHRPNSIPLYVLWGKALIGLHRAAAAMEQFEKAIAIDRQNPYPYRLICDALLRKGLYRSALPLLRKAVALEPDNTQLREALEQAQLAMSKGPGTSWPPLEILNASLTPPPSLVPAAKTVKPPIPPPAGENEPPPPADAISPLELPKIPIPESVVSAEHPTEAPSTEPHRPGLLHDLPEPAEPLPAVEAPSTAPVSAQAAAEIAKHYERELHEEFTQEKTRKSFLAQHGWKLAVATVLLVAIAVGTANFLRTRAINRGQDLKDALALAKKAIALDTRQSYAAALEHLARAVAMDEGSRPAWALSGYVQSLLVAEHGADANTYGKAVAALEHPQVRAEFPGLALAADYYLSKGPQRESAKAAVLSAKLQDPEVQELAGRILLAQNDSKGALARFAEALKSSPNHVRSLIALADYYRGAGDYSSALKFYSGTAAQLSPEHPGRIVGAAESRLALGIDLDEALKDVERLPSPEELPSQLVARKELAHGKLLVAARQAQKAIDKLQKGARAFPSLEYEFQLSLAEAYRSAAEMERAQRSLEAALKLRPKSEEAKAALGRILIARDREREVLSRLPPEPRSRQISLVRGEAYAKAEDWKRARSELANTQVEGKYPSEAVLYLALADLAEGQAERAQSTLEKALATSRKVKSELRVGLGKVYWQRGILDKARSQFEEAAKDPDDFEGHCALGRMLLSHGTPEAAAERLLQAVARNPSHGEARHALGRAYLDLGKVSEAFVQFDAWEKENPSAAAQKDLALALFHGGRFKEAEAAVNRVLRLLPQDSEAHRVRALVLFSRGQTRSGLSELQAANHLAPHDSETFCEIGRAFERQGDSSSALKAFAAAKREDVESACAAIGLHSAKLPSYERGGSKALSALAARAPRIWDKAFAESTLARWWLAVGAVKDARKAAEQAVAHNPYDSQGHYALGLAALRMKDDERARAELIKAVELDPGNGLLRLALADFLARSPEARPQAVEQYNAFLRIGGNRKDEARVRRLVASLKKSLASG